MTIRGKACIAGAYEHPTRKAPDKTVAQLHAECAQGALADAGLSLHDVDGYFCAGDAPGLGALSMADYLGLQCCHVDSTDTGGSSYLCMFRTQHKPLQQASATSHSSRLQVVPAQNQALAPSPETGAKTCPMSPSSCPMAWSLSTTMPWWQRATCMTGAPRPSSWLGSKWLPLITHNTTPMPCSVMWSQLQTCLHHP